MNNQCCGNCVYWMRKLPDVAIPPGDATKEPAVDPRISGYCRAHPPVRLSIEERNQLGITKAAASFPTINDDQWCGEWKALPKALPNFVVTPARGNQSKASNATQS